MSPRKKKNPGALTAAEKAQLDAEINAALEDLDTYIGVMPGSDLATIGAPGGTPQFGPSEMPLLAAKKPKYRESYLQSAEFSREMSGFSPAAVAALQAQLVRAGLLSVYAPSDWGDPNTIRAMNELLGMANQTASDWQSTLTRLIDAGGVKKKEETETPSILHLVSRNEVLEMTRPLAKSLYGGNLPEETIDAITTALNEAATRQDAAEKSLVETGGTMTDEASPDAIAEQKIRELHPDQAAGMEMQEAYSTFMQTMFGKPVGYQEPLALGQAR